MSLIIISKVKIKSLNINLNIKNWLSYSLISDNIIIIIICLHKDSNDKNSKFKIKILF